MKYIVTVAYGEYDDYNRLPLCVVDDKDSADFIVQSLYDREDFVMELFNRLDLYEPIDNCSFGWDEVPYFKL